MNESVLTFIRKNVPAIASKVIDHVRPCINAHPEKQDDHAIPIGGSKFGGCPDVPAKFSWPMTKDGPCWFVAQVSLEEIKGLDAGIQLPRAGLLSFFYHDARGPAGVESKVFFFAEPTLRRMDLVKDTRYGKDFHERHFFPRALRFTQGFCLPTDHASFHLTDEEMLIYNEFDDFVASFNDEFAGGIHQLFGLPRYLEAPANHLLLASFGQVHDRYLYYIPTSAARTLDVSKLKVIYKCT